MPKKVYKTREQWLRARHQGIGASDAPVILGLSPWESAYSLWCAKINPVVDWDNGTIRQRIGSMQEKSIAEIYACEHGAVLSNPGKYTIHQHPEYPWMLATLDRIQHNDEEGVCEIKNVDRFRADAWFQKSADGVYYRDEAGRFCERSNAAKSCPLLYQVQVQHQLAVTGYQWGVIVALIGGNDLQVRRIERNQRLIDAMIPKLQRFWECVTTRTAPPVDAHERTSEVLNSIRETPGSVVELPDSYSKHASKLEQIARIKKKIEDRETMIKNEVRAALGEASAGYLEDGRGWTYREQIRKEELRVDTTLEPLLIDSNIPFERAGGTKTRVLRTSHRKG